MKRRKTQLSENEKTRTAKGRVQVELEELRERNEKLGNLLGKVKSENMPNHQKLLDSLSREQRRLLNKQFKVQREYIRILEKRLKIWVDEA